ncbi:hypothetical protein EWI07_00030 [Sporolactobacillus sp. THM7-4]|nr:hypothetical protein EWI07_00030 [Sporolactobacillus sp. THM7-4]
MKKLEALLWSIALPGFPQLLQGDYFKGLLFIVMEFVINVSSHFNEAIFLSFNGQTDQSLSVMNIQWLLFYPCLYFFAMWDAYKNAEGKTEEGTFLLFCFSAFFVTLGLIFSIRIKINAFRPGPVFLPILSVIPGLLTGWVLKKLIYRHRRL